MAHAPTTWNSVWITGGSSGIGRAFAIRLAARGVRVAVSARSADDLAALAAAHPGITAYPLDVTDREAVAATAQRIAAEQGPIDLAVLSAGVFRPMSARNFSAATTSDVMAINYNGICNALEPLLPAMLARGEGQIALLSSVAGFAGLPKLAPYCASKAAVNTLAESLYTELRPKGIALSMVAPGYIATPMTEANELPMPFLISLDEAVRRMEKGLLKRRFEVTFPWRVAFLLKMYRRAPYPLFFWIARNFLMPPSRRQDAGTRDERREPA